MLSVLIRSTSVKPVETVHNYMSLIFSESGMELMVQLTVLTGIQFSSPTGIIGSYNHGKF